MKRLFLGVAIASALGLTGCGGDTYNDIKAETTPLIPESQMIFDPANGAVPIPNDLLFNGTLDGTLAIPGEESGDYLNPEIALGALDGWSTTSPISIDLAPATAQDGTKLTVDAASAAQPGAVRVFEATVGGALSSDPECADALSVSACKVGDELQFGVDFVTQASGNSIVVVPLKPLKFNQSYIYALTDVVKDSEGRSFTASPTYRSLEEDIDTLPLETPDQLFLQGLVNSYEKGIAAAHGVDPESVIYSGLFTTQSIPNVYETVKLLMADPTDGNPYQPQLVTPPTPLGYSAAVAAGLTPEAGATYAMADIADMYAAQIKLPIYGDCSSTACLSDAGEPLINGRWMAQGDSPVGVLLALQAGTLSQAKFGEQAIAQGVDPQAALANPALLAGKTWLLDDGTPVDATKHLTKFNPIPKIKGYETVDVMMAIPNGAKLAGFLQAQGLPFEAPTAGWPAVMAMHGLGGGKEMALAYTGAYAAQGIAVIAIDMPLHGGRSYDANNDGVYEVSATDPAFGAVIGQPNAFAAGNPLVFVNIASTLSVRDNFRQAVADHLGVRLVLSGLAQQLAALQQPQIFDVSKISVQGLSLGGIVGTNFSTYANTGMVNPATGEAVVPNPYGINASSLVAPSGGLAGSFAGSATFGPVLFDTIVATEDFQALVDEANTSGFEPGTPEYAALVQAVYEGFIPAFALAVQTAVDSADPVNHGGMLAATNTPVHLIEVTGDGAGNLPDQVLPNAVEGFPVSGTEPLIRAIGLDCVDSTTQGSGAVRFAKGHHSSVVDPSEIDGVTDGSALAATAEMQFQVSSFARSAGLGQATILVNDDSVLKSCGD
ncbi:lipase [Shewanella submarina]|uniref:VolA/Pla-1 family phospholipase n=1 Tax=Shewanella submarina TaxID=2016376 RepID=A0ABV7GCK1_9GAMM|nr:VolA/Pla-1 family phospholipase [Shewanella submarina]MCL1036625.1 lipase [Shewanella submarina]